MRFYPRRPRILSRRSSTAAAVMVDFIDDHRDQYGVDPICAVLPIVPSTLRHGSQLDPTRRSRRVQRDDELREAIQRLSAYRPEGVPVARAAPSAA